MSDPIACVETHEHSPAQFFPSPDSLDRASKLALLVETMPAGWAEFHRIGGAYVCVEANAAFERLTGMAQGSAPGVHADVIFPQIGPALDAAGHDGVEQKLELHRPATDRWFSATVFRCPPEHVFAMIDDITERRHYLERERRAAEQYGALISVSAQVVWLSEPDGRMSEPSESWRAFTGQPFEASREFGWLDAIHPGDCEALRVTWLDNARSGEHFTAECRIRHVSGEWRWTSTRAAPLLDARGNLRSWVAMGTDVTESKLAEQRNRDLNESLARSNRELEQFAYIASHDLQEPLRMVASYTEMLRDRYQGKLDEKADKYIRYAVDGAKRMQELINDLLALSRVGTRAQRLETIDLGDALGQSLSNLSRTIEETRAVIDIGDLPVLRADRTQMAQVFQNLIGNSLKFRGPDTPHVRIGARPSGTMWEIEVADNGIGIDPEFHQRIFQVFQRLHERGQYEGSGIGLAIVKKIVERHGGSVRVISALGQGANFLFTLPHAAGKDSE